MYDLSYLGTEDDDGKPTHLVFEDVDNMIKWILDNFKDIQFYRMPGRIFQSVCQMKKDGVEYFLTVIAYVDSGVNYLMERMTEGREEHYQFWTVVPT